MQAQATQSKFPELFRFRAPRGFPAAISAAAARQHQSASDYVRQLLIAELRRNGLTIDSTNGLKNEQ